MVPLLVFAVREIYDVHALAILYALFYFLNCLLMQIQHFLTTELLQTELLQKVIQVSKKLFIRHWSSVAILEKAILSPMPLKVLGLPSNAMGVCCGICAPSLEQDALA